MRAIGARPSSAAAAALVTTSAAAPSVMPGALPAVTLPSLPKAGRRPASERASVSRRGGSSALIVGLAAASRHLDGHALVGERARVLRGDRAGVRFERK